MDRAGSIPFLTFKKSYDYIFSKTTLYSDEIFRGFYGASSQFCLSAFKMVVSFVAMLTYLLVASLKLGIMIFPHLLAAAKAIIKFHRTQLSWSDILIEFTIIFLVTVILIFHKRIVAKWKKIEAIVAKKSKAAAKAAPHVAFFSFSLIVSILGRKFLIHIASPSVLPIITLVVPTVMTVMDLLKLSRLSDRAENKKYRPSPTQSSILKQKLALWVVLAVYHTIATGLSLVPFSSKILRVLPFVRETIAVIFIWAQVSLQFTEIIFEAAAPILKTFADRIPSSNFGANQGSSILSVLRTIRGISVTQEVFLKSLLQDGFLCILFAMFIFMPTRMANIGVIIIALLFPAFRSSNCIFRAAGGNSPTKDVVAAEKMRWLQYWVCLGCLWTARCYGFKMWPSFIMLTCLWLQHSLFRGGEWLFRHTVGTWTALYERHKLIEEEKEKRQRLRDRSSSLDSSASTVSIVADEESETSSEIEASGVIRRRVSVVVSGGGRHQRRRSSAISDEERGQERSTTAAGGDDSAEEGNDSPGTNDEGAGEEQEVAAAAKSTSKSNNDRQKRISLSSSSSSSSSTTAESSRGRGVEDEFVLIIGDDENKSERGVAEEEDDDGYRRSEECTTPDILRSTMMMTDDGVTPVTAAAAAAPSVEVSSHNSGNSSAKKKEPRSRRKVD